MTNDEPGKSAETWLPRADEHWMEHELLPNLDAVRAQASRDNIQWLHEWAKMMLTSLTNQRARPKPALEAKAAALDDARAERDRYIDLYQRKTAVAADLQARLLAAINARLAGKGEGDGL